MRLRTILAALLVFALVGGPATAAQVRDVPDDGHRDDVVESTEPADLPGDRPVIDEVADQSVDAVPGPVTDEPAIDPVRDHMADRATDVIRDGETDRITDVVRDRPVDQCPEVDRLWDGCCPDRATDHARCDHEPSHDINIRHLILRLVEGHHWEKLLQVLHRLGVI